MSRFSAPARTEPTPLTSLPHPRLHTHLQLLLRSPALPHPSTLPPHLLSTDPVLPQLPPYPGQAPTDADADAGGSDAEKWFRTGIKAEMSTEGTLWLVESTVQ